MPWDNGWGLVFISSAYLPVREPSDCLPSSPGVVGLRRHMQEFITYRRPEHLSVPRYCRAFQQKLKKLQASGCVIADNILTVKVIECANLSDFEEVLIRATVTETT